MDASCEVSTLSFCTSNPSFFYSWFPLFLIPESLLFLPDPEILPHTRSLNLNPESLTAGQVVGYVSAEDDMRPKTADETPEE